MKYYANYGWFHFHCRTQWARVHKGQRQKVEGELKGERRRERKRDSQCHERQCKWIKIKWQKKWKLKCNAVRCHAPYCLPLCCCTLWHSPLSPTTPTAFCLCLSLQAVVALGCLSAASWRCTLQRCPFATCHLPVACLPCLALSVCLFAPSWR